MDKLEAFLRRRIKTIFPHIDGYEKRLEEGNIARLSTYLSDLCDKYAQKVIDNPSHRLADLVPKRQSEHGRHSSRLPNALIRSQRTEFLRNSLFHKHGV